MRSRLMMTLVVVLACCSWLVGTAGPLGAGPTDPTVVFGAATVPRGGETKVQTITNLESQLGRKLAMVRVYYSWDEPFPDSYINWLQSTGHNLFLSVRAKRTNSTYVSWRTIADAQPGSALYNDMVGWATKVRGLGTRTYFAFNHEPETVQNLNNGTATDYIAAWRKVVTIFRAQGVTNATYVWIMTAHSFHVTDRRAARLWFPGDSYVDGLGADAYNWYTCRNDGVTIPWRTLAWLVEPFRQFGLAHPTKKLMLPEFASAEDPAAPNRKAQWIADAQALFKSPGYEQFTAALYYHKGGTSYPSCLWWADTTPAAFTALKTMANDPYYTAKP